MGCKVSKSVDAVTSISNKKQKVENEVELGDHGQLMPGSLTQQKKSSATPPVKGREAFSPRRGARPVPRARTFLEDSDGPASDPAKLRELENSAPVPLLGQPGYLAHNRTRGRGGMGGGGGGVSTTEIEELQEDWDAALGRRSGTKTVLGVPAQPTPRGGSTSLPGMMGNDAVALDHDEVRRIKKKKDKNRVTDLEEFDLEAEDPDTVEARLKKNAAKKVGNVGIVSAGVRKTVFGDIEDFSDDELTPRGGGRGGGGGGRGGRGGPGPGAGSFNRPKPGGFGVSASIGGPILQGAGLKKSGLAPLGPASRRSLPGGLPGGLPVGGLGGVRGGGGFGGDGGFGADHTEGPVMGSLLAPVRRSKPLNNSAAPPQPVPVYQHQQHQQQQEPPLTPEPTLQRASGGGGGAALAARVMDLEAESMPSPIPMQPTVTESPALPPPCPAPKKEDSYDDFSRKDDEEVKEEEMKGEKRFSAQVAPSPPPPRRDDSYEDLTWKDDEDEYDNNKSLAPGGAHHHHGGGGVEGGQILAEEDSAEVLPSVTGEPSMSMSLLDAEERALMAELAGDDTPVASPATIAMVRAVPDAMEDSDMDEDIEEATAAPASHEVTVRRSLDDEDPSSSYYGDETSKRRDKPASEEYKQQATAALVPDEIDGYAAIGYDESMLADPETPRFNPEHLSSEPEDAGAMDEEEPELSAPAPTADDDDPWSGFQGDYGLAGARKSGVLGDLDGDPLNDSLEKYRMKQEDREWEEGGTRTGVRMSTNRRRQHEETLLLDDDDSTPKASRGFRLGPDAGLWHQGGDGGGLDDSHETHRGGSASGVGWAGAGMDDDDDDGFFEAGGGVDYDDLGGSRGSSPGLDDADVFGDAAPAKGGGGRPAADVFSAEISELDMSASSKI